MKNMQKKHERNACNSCNSWIWMPKKIPTLMEICSICKEKDLYSSWTAYCYLDCNLCRTNCFWCETCLNGQILHLFRISHHWQANNFPLTKQVFVFNSWKCHKKFIRFFFCNSFKLIDIYCTFVVQTVVKNAFKWWQNK